MRRRGTFLVAGLAGLMAGTLLLAAPVSAQDDEGFEDLMERGIQMMGSLGINLKAKDGPASVEDAKQAAAAFADIYAFFEKRKIADAMQFAKGVQDGFTQAGELAAAGKLEEALAKYQVTRTHCDGCHQAHRTRNTDGSYSIK